MSRFSEMRKTQALIAAGYIAGAKGLPCEAPITVQSDVPIGTSGELNRQAWEQGWRAGHEWYQGASIEVASVEAI